MKIVERVFERKIKWQKLKNNMLQIFEEKLEEEKLNLITYKNAIKAIFKCLIDLLQNNVLHSTFPNCILIILLKFSSVFSNI